jgi:protein-S-isoprenylcysteine O-methyltransferase Ste14
MSIDKVILIVVIVIWITTEIYLILRDKSYGKGKTTIDKRTRIYNTIATTIAMGLPPVITWIPIFGLNNKVISFLFWIGIAVLSLGFLLRQWSISILGRYFRTTIELEKDQKVIQKGPYKYIRHPSYSGIILFFIGYGIAYQNWISVVIAVIFPTMSLLYRIKNEEIVLVKEIGKEYYIYKGKTKKLIPGIW